MTNFADQSVSLATHHAEIDSRNALIGDLLKMIADLRSEANQKQAMAVVEGNWAEICAAEIVARVVTTLLNRANDRVHAFSVEEVPE